MKAELKNIISFDIDEKLEQWKPFDKTDFEITLKLTIGIVGENGGDYFDVDIYSYKTYIKFFNKPNNTLEKGIIILEEYNYSNIKSEIIGIISKCENDNWLSIANCLSKKFNWEFENYSLT